MNLKDIPFAGMIRLSEAEGEYTFALDDDIAYTNHLGTVAAAAQFSLAEFTSGQWLLDTFPDLAQQAIPMLRKSSVKFKTPGKGRVRAKVQVSETTALEVRKQLTEKKRALCEIEVVVVNDEEKVIMIGIFEWFITLN
jgi:acyl-coenzyme A thioesterase PaaI-like protein